MAGVGFVRPKTPRQIAVALWVAMETEPDSIKGQDARDRLQVCFHHPHAHHHHPHLHLIFFVQTAPRPGEGGDEGSEQKRGRSPGGDCEDQLQEGYGCNQLGHVSSNRASL